MKSWRNSTRHRATHNVGKRLCQVNRERLCGGLVNFSENMMAIMEGLLSLLFFTAHTQIIIRALNALVSNTTNVLLAIVTISRMHNLDLFVLFLLNCNWFLSDLLFNGLLFVLLLLLLVLTQFSNSAVDFTQQLLIGFISQVRYKAQSGLQGL